MRQQLDNPNVVFAIPTCLLFQPVCIAPRCLYQYIQTIIAG